MRRYCQSVSVSDLDAKARASANQFDNILATLGGDDDTLDWDDEFSQYLAAPRHIVMIGDQFCPLEWWQRRAHIFPRLSRMAFDYLSTPGTCIHCSFVDVY